MAVSLQKPRIMPGFPIRAFPENPEVCPDSIGGQNGSEIKKGGWHGVFITVFHAPKKIGDGIGMHVKMNTAKLHREILESRIISSDETGTCGVIVFVGMIPVGVKFRMNFLFNTER